MNKILLIVLFAFLAGCAKEPPFDPVAVFKDAEEKMRKERYEDARKAYQEIQEKAPDRSYDADIMLRIADTYFGDEKYSEALVEYQSFLNFHPVHRDAPYAQFQKAMCSYKELTTIDRDPGLVRAALKEFQTLLEKYPNSTYEAQARSYVSICRDRLAGYELYVGRFYHKKGSYRAAIGRLEKLVADYPGSGSEKDALLYAGLSHMELGEKAEARQTFEKLTSRYPSMADQVTPLITKLNTQP
ncbi:MAG: outer membrane protein assembly factor BamD [Nitrospirota bacterium]|nr:outer membrane protein assembly factor BamD [Nitrospirota bacterium]